MKISCKLLYKACQFERGNTLLLTGDNYALTFDKLLPSLPAPSAAPYHVAMPLDQPESSRRNSMDAQEWRRKAKAAMAVKDNTWSLEAI